MEQQEQKRVNSIDIFRLLCALLVVIIHTSPFTDMNETLGFIVVQILPRIAVPFFFCISGYYYIEKLNDGKFVCKQTFLKVLKLYIFWACIYYIRDFILYMYTGSLNIKGIIHTFIVTFFTSGASYHFWYFVCLLFSIVAVGLFYKLHAQKALPFVATFLYIIGLLGCSYYAIGAQIPFLTKIINSQSFTLIRRTFLMGFPFFCMGGMLEPMRKKIKNHILIKILISGVLFLAEIVIVVKCHLQSNIIITIFLPVLLVFVVAYLIDHPLSNHNAVAKKCRSLANYTFYVHPLFIWTLQTTIAQHISNFALFTLTVTCCIVSWLLLSKVDNRIIKKYVV